jgi:hypothetical protein
MHTNTRTYIRPYTRTYIYTCIQTHAHTQMHTYKDLKSMGVSVSFISSEERPYEVCIVYFYIVYYCIVILYLVLVWQSFLPVVVTFLAYFPKIGSYDLRPLSVSVYPPPPPSNFECLNQSLWHLVYIMAPDPISRAYFINPSSQSVCLHLYHPYRC